MSCNTCNQEKCCCPEKRVSVVGKQGPAGPVGKTGAQGARGDNGTNGTNGANGDPGEPGADGTPQIIQDEGVPLPQRNIMDFQGTGVVAVDEGGKTVIKIGTTNNSIVAEKASSLSGGDYTIPNIPLTVNQSYILNNTDSVVMDNWKQITSSLGGFNPTTGGWTVPATGFYNIRIRLYICAKPSANSIADLEVGDFGKGSLMLGYVNPVNNFVRVFQEFGTNGTAGSDSSTTGNRTSVVLIDQTILRVNLTAGEQYFVKVLNKTEHAYTKSSNSVAVYQSLALLIDETI